MRAWLGPTELRQARIASLITNQFQREIPSSLAAEIAPSISIVLNVGGTVKQAAHIFEIGTRGQRLYDCTSTITQWVRQQAMQTGLLTVFCRHTSASLLIQENADPTVRTDLEAFFNRLAPQAGPQSGPYRHNSEGPDDMPAHLKTALTQVQLSIPLVDSELAWEPGRASTSSNTGYARTAARSSCTSSETEPPAQRNRVRDKPTPSWRKQRHRRPTLELQAKGP